jgi:hypothetical protein
MDSSNMPTEPLDFADLDAMLEFERSTGWNIVQGRIREELGRKRADLEGNGDVPRLRGEIKALLEVLSYPEFLKHEIRGQLTK